jgi:hypothetical protein
LVIDIVWRGALRKTTLRIAPMFRIKLGNFEQAGSRFGHICGGQGMIPKKPDTDLIRGVKRLSEKIRP